jgi:hypothetical protein
MAASAARRAFRACVTEVKSRTMGAFTIDSQNRPQTLSGATKRQEAGMNCKKH